MSGEELAPAVGQVAEFGAGQREELCGVGGGLLHGGQAIQDGAAGVVHSGGHLGSPDPAGRLVHGADGGLVQRPAQASCLLRGQHRGGARRGDEHYSLVLDQDHQRPVAAERIDATYGPSGFSHRYDIGPRKG